MHKHPWKYANVRLIPCSILLLAGSILAKADGGIRKGSFNHKAVSSVGVVVFVLFASAFLHIATKIVFMLLTSHHLSVGRAAVIKFLLRLIGYASILLTTLDLLGISVGRLVLGGAVLGIILGVAAQQALANFFASIVLIFAHPFYVGEDIVLVSGALGGTYEGRVIDLGLTHTRIRDKDGNVVYLPNATLLAGAAIRSQKPHPKIDMPKQS
jgi:small-conductance mechanosensitive channel